MKRATMSAIVIMAILLSAGATKEDLHAARSPSAGAQQDGAATARAMIATIADFAWLKGRWTGTVGTGTTEEICSGAEAGVMICMFRAMNDGKTQGLEFITLRDAPPGVEERVRFFESDLAEEQGDNGIALHVASLSPTVIIFNNAKQVGPVKHVTITRSGDDTFSTHIELVDGAGKSSFIDAQWRREK
jgi:hypothetical protein